MNFMLQRDGCNLAAPLSKIFDPKEKALSLYEYVFLSLKGRRGASNIGTLESSDTAQSTDVK